MKNIGSIPLNTQSLSNRELEVIELVAYEYSTKEIAQKLFLSTETIKTYRKILFQKLDVTNVAGLVRVACQHHLIAY